MLDDRALRKIQKIVEQKFEIRVGIMGGPRNDGDSTNAEVGAVHEYGLGQPVRSFLRMPMKDHFRRVLSQSKGFDPATLQKVVTEKSLKRYAQKIALVAEATIQEAFDTGGFGQWPRSNWDAKKNQQTLVETGQLRKAITSKVEAKK